MVRRQSGGRPTTGKCTEAGAMPRRRAHFEERAYPSAPRYCLLIRHCQAVSQASQAPLTDAGRRQSAALADFLAERPVDYIVSSSFVRARQSIAPFAHRSGLAVNVDPRLSERRLSGRPMANWQQIVRDSFAALDLRLPGGESGREVQQRAWAALRETMQRGHVLPIFVTHGNLISLLLHSLDPGFGYRQWAALSNPDVFQLEDRGRGCWRIERIWS